MLVIATGKGGVGKSTLVGILARYLQQQQRKFCLVDADPVGRVGDLLDAPKTTNIADLAYAPAGSTAEDWINAQLAALLVSLPNGGDFLRMGHPVTEGCFCRVNTLTKATINLLVMKYPIVLVDNEAGVEHLTRGVGRYVSRMVLVADGSQAALTVAGDALSTVRALNTDGQRLQGSAHLLVREPAYSNADWQALIQRRAGELQLPAPVMLPNDAQVAMQQMLGHPLPGYNGELRGLPLYQAVQAWVETTRLFEVKQE